MRACVCARVHVHVRVRVHVRVQIKRFAEVELIYVKADPAQLIPFLVPFV